MSVARHAISVSSAGAKVAGDPLITCSASAHTQLGTGIYTAEATNPIAAADSAGMLVTRRGTSGLRYYVAPQHSSDTIKRFVVRDNAGTLLDSAFDVLILANVGSSSSLSQYVRGSVVGSTGAKFAGGSFTPARTGAGVWTLTLPTAQPAASSIVIVTRRGTGLRAHWTVEHVSDTVKRVYCVDHNAAALDSDFDFSIWTVAA